MDLQTNMCVFFTYSLSRVGRLLSLGLLTSRHEGLKVRESALYCLLIIVCLVLIREFF